MGVFPTTHDIFGILTEGVQGLQMPLVRQPPEAANPETNMAGATLRITKPTSAQLITGLITMTGIASHHHHM